MKMDGLTEMDVVESILNAVAIYKKIRSRSSSRRGPREYLYVIYGTNLEGLVIYTKGKLLKSGESVRYYFLISSKRGV
jgi:hypothetical protein